jgi:hypothetical protein
MYISFTVINRLTLKEMAAKKPAKKTTAKPAAKPDPKKATPKKGGKKALATMSTSKNSVYVPVSHHIYFDGSSYRVRVAIKGKTISQSFSSKKKAFAHRKEMLSVQG